MVTWMSVKRYNTSVNKYPHATINILSLTKKIKIIKWKTQAWREFEISEKYVTATNLRTSKPQPLVRNSVSDDT